MKAVREAALSVDGVTKADVSLRKKTARVTARQGTNANEIEQAIESAGRYSVELADE